MLLCSRCDFCLICHASNLKCSFIDSVCVSSCICCVLVSVVHSVDILSALFCVICSLLMCVSDASVDHMVETYSSMGLVISLYVVSIIPFVFHMLLMRVL